MSRANHPLDFASFLQRTPALSRVATQAKQHDVERDDLKNMLPAGLRDQVLIYRDDDCLLIAVRNNAVAQFVHFQGRNLLQAAGCDRLKIKVSDADFHNDSSTKNTHTPNRYMSAKTGDILRAGADSFDDPELAEAFRRLADNAGK